MPILKDTSLAMIVGHEFMNPAGGLLPVIEMQMDNYEEILILRTRSLNWAGQAIADDGTSGLLDCLAGLHRNIRLFDDPFLDYSTARNYLHQHIQTRWAMVTDADELFTRENARLIAGNYHQDHPVYSLCVVDVIPGPVEMVAQQTVGTRLYQPSEAHWKNKVWEVLEYKGMYESLCPVSSRILHFKPTEINLLRKGSDWYARFQATNGGISQIEVPSFWDWKLPDPKTLAAYGIDIYSVVDRLKGMGLEIPDIITQNI